ncbi:MAG: hypothetical protein ACTS4Z_01000 [Candidatus Hodgkinia cicadicola]
MERLTTFEVCLATDVTFPESKTEERERKEGKERAFLYLAGTKGSLFGLEVKFFRLFDFAFGLRLNFRNESVQRFTFLAFGPSGFQPLSPPLILYESCFRCSLLRSPSGF